MKNHLRNVYEPHQRFVLRTPLFPVSLFVDWAAQEEDALIPSLKAFYEKPLVQEAVYIASPDMHSQIKLWLDGKITKPEKVQKTIQSLVKYFGRMCTRSTPYGLFAGCATGVLGNTTNLRIADNQQLCRMARLDMDYVCQLADKMSKNPSLKSTLRYYPNTSLYISGTDIRYIEARFHEEKGRSYHLVSVEQSPYLLAVLEAAKNGIDVYSAISLLADEDISREEAENFISELIECQLLISELAPTVTGKPYVQLLSERLADFSDTQEVLSTLNTVNQMLESLRFTTSASSDIYEQVARLLKPLGVPIQMKSLIQVDCMKTLSHHHLQQSIADDILEGASLLWRIGKHEKADTFVHFKRDFTARYENQFVPLTDVLDTESGIGYHRFEPGTMDYLPLLDTMPVGRGRKQTQDLRANTNYTDDFKWALYEEAIRDRKTQVVLSDEVVNKTPTAPSGNSSLADSAFAMVKIHAANTDALNAKDYQIEIAGLSGPSGARLLGRFAYQEEIGDLCREITTAEEALDPDCLFAEIVHLPESRIGNILLRPHLRDWEIPFLCASSKDKSQQIKLDDITVGIIANEVVLFSRQHQKRIMPRLSSAHNYSTTSLPVYQFLCDLQYQRIQSYGWSWGVLSSRPFLPRVSYGKFILCEARWILKESQLSHLTQLESHALVDAFALLANDLLLPRHVLITQGDNELCIDIRNHWCLQLLLATIRKQRTVTLTEMIATPDRNWIEGEGGTYSNEFIFAFSKKQAEEKKNKSKHLPLSNSRLQRHVHLGDEWLYVKIYTGTKAAEQLLSQVIHPLNKELQREGWSKEMFFIRYHDTDHHLRLRYCASERPDACWQILRALKAAVQPWIDNGSITRFQTDTYQREIERYGQHTMRLSESWFAFNSQAVLDFIAGLSGDDGEELRWQGALWGVNSILDDFGLTLKDKAQFVVKRREAFSREFGIQTPERQMISDRYRSHKKKIEQLFFKYDSNTDNELHQLCLHSFGRCSNDYAYQQLIRKIKTTQEVQKNSDVLPDLLASYIHMFLNRIFVSSQRAQEMIVFDFLSRTYESMLARAPKLPVMDEV